jgi:mannosylglucosylglycerate synthase
MRIAILHYTQPPVIGGVERVIRDQAKALIALGHEVVILTREQSSQCLTAEVVIVHNVFTMPFDLAWTRELHAIALSNPQIRWINWVHDVAAVNPSYAHLPWDDPEMARLKTLPRAIHIAVSEVRRQEYLFATGLEPSHCCVIPNGVDVAGCLGLTKRVKDWVQDLKLWERDIVLFHPTRLLRRKNIEMGLRVAHALVSGGLNVAYLVSGAADPHQTDGVVYQNELNREAKSLGMESHFFFLGDGDPLSDDDVRGIYSIADALFFPSFSEGFGLPVIEAGLHLLPAFCSDIPAHREVGGSFAQFFPTNEDPAKIAREIMEHPGVTARRDRRNQLAGKVDWLRICVAYLEPLLNGTSHNS